MASSPSLSTESLPYLNYAQLRAEGIRLLERLVSAQWSDFNAHDPGITILEQLCYAITDLGYRTAYPVPDLLAGSTELGLPGPEAILTGDPVTCTDVRKVALDVAGVRNAWVDPQTDPELRCYYRAASGELHLRPEPGEFEAQPARLLGLLRVSLQTTKDAALVDVADRLHRMRALGQDFEVVRRETFAVSMHAAIEIGAVEDPVQVLAAIVERIADYLAPAAVFETVAQARASRRSDELFEGPLLQGGVVSPLREPPPVVYVSDIVHLILDVPGTRAVRSLELGTGGSARSERWALTVPTGRSAMLAPNSQLRLFRNGIEIPVDSAKARQQTEDRRAARPAPPTDGAAGSRVAGRPRNLGVHPSIRHQLPAAYGVGALGLSPTASPARRAQAYQLEGYLLLFDQLLANAFAQLAHARLLLSPEEQDGRTYWSNPVNDPELCLERLRVQDPEQHRVWLDQAIESGAPLERHKRLLAHLLARFAEQLGDHSLVAGDRKRPPTHADTPITTPDQDLVADRRSFLSDYPRLSGARGSGYNLLRYPNADADSGFEARLRHKLGLRAHPPFAVIEHLLLRPIAEDARQLTDEGEVEVPLLADVARDDPWSLQLTVVLQDTSEARDKTADSYARLVEDTILAELPAHLTPYVLWLSGQDWNRFSEASDAFWNWYRDYRSWALDGRLPERLRGEDPAIARTLLQLSFRDARDRLIDMLGIGHTYPLRDLPLNPRVIVTPGAPTTIPMAFSQRDVAYELYRLDAGAAKALGDPLAVVDGTGEPIEIPTPPIGSDATYRILAVKRERATAGPRREAWLRTTVRLEETVDPSLSVRIRDNLPLLDSSIDAPTPTDARVGDFGVCAEVEVLASQVGVVYELIEHRDELGAFKDQRVISEAPVTGTGQTIGLRTIPMHEDIDIRVRGSKAVGVPPQPREAVLKLVLALRVRADRGLDVQLSRSVIEHNGSSALRILQTQASATYQVWQHRVRDAEFVFDEPPGTATIDVPVETRAVRIRRPKQTTVWEDLAGFEPIGAAVQGTGGTLEVELASRDADALFLVQAKKLHLTKSGNAKQIASAVKLDRAQALLVGPNPQAPLRLVAELRGDRTNGPLIVENGQPGVFYELRREGAPDLLARPAYFHKRDDLDSRLNQGIEQLHLGVDFVVARGRPAGDPASTAPMAPAVEVPDLPIGAILRIAAHKAMTGLPAELSLPAMIDGVPEVTVEPPQIAAGASATIVVAQSRPHERYRLLVAGSPIGPVHEGDGGRIELPTGVLAQTTTVVVSVTSADSDSLAVERRVDVVVEVTG